MNEKIASIQRTDDYDRFKRLTGNRSVTEARVAKIIKSIDEVGYVLSPICINEKWEIIDGQGRFEALKRLHMPIDYYMVDGIGLNECVSLNIHQSNWNLRNYIDSYAESGNSSYLYLHSLVEKYSDMPMRAIFNAITGKADMATDAIKKGNFVCDSADYVQATKILDYERRFKKFFKRIKGKIEYYYAVIGFCYRHESVDKERLYDKMDTLQAELIPVSNIEQAFEVVESIYNNRARAPQKVYLLTEYKKAMSNTYAWYENKWGKRA